MAADYLRLSMSNSDAYNCAKLVLNVLHAIFVFCGHFWCIHLLEFRVSIFKASVSSSLTVLGCSRRAIKLDFADRYRPFAMMLVLLSIKFASPMASETQSLLANLSSHSLRSNN